MLDLLIKKIKNNKAIVTSSCVLLFTMFATLNILFLFCWNFFGSIYLYSFGYSDTSYYSRNPVSYDVVEREYKEEDVAWSYDIENSLVDGNILFSTAYCDENTLYGDFGLCLDSRVFVRMKDVSSRETSRYYCFVSDNFKTQEKTLTKNDIAYPIAGTFHLEMTSEIKKSFRQSGIDDIELALFIDKRIIPHSVNLIVDNAKGSYHMDTDFLSGKDLNSQVVNGYSLFQPMIYVGYLVPMIACAVSFLLILSSIQNKSLEELKTLRILSFRKKDIFRLLFLERLFECLVGAVSSYILFVPFYAIVLKEFYPVSFIILFLQLVYAVLLLLIYSRKEVKKIYKKGGIL